jgi:pimeloyl-ACP methyl ester carboxylesterase
MTQQQKFISRNTSNRLYKYIFAIVCLQPIFSYAQESEGNIVKDKKTGCAVWFKHIFGEDSITWSGGCKNGFADGQGNMVGFTKGQQTSSYIGEMRNGRLHGKGVFKFGGDRKLEGNFSNGEPLFLNDELLKKLDKNILYESDPNAAYDGDNNAQQLYYHAIVPDGQLKGAVVLMPGTWETTEHLLSSLSIFCELAYKNKLAIIVPSINQRLTLTDETVKLMNSMFSHAIQKYHLQKNKLVMAGWSMGGIFSMRYTELANQDSTRTVVKPLAVINCDGPCDLKNIYNNFKRKLNKNPGQNEPAYGMREMEKYCGGTPEAAPEKYEYYSPYTHLKNGGNTKYLLNTPLRIYGDVDPEWWMKNRHVDMYDLNALDQTAMIQWLNDNGNNKAEFINAYKKGIRLEGNRHPHSWSIIEPYECMNWIVKNINR